MKRKLRAAQRKVANGIEISNLHSFGHFGQIAKEAHLIDVSSSGLLIQVHRDAFLSKSLKDSINLDDLIGEPLMFSISLMDLEIDGLITRTKAIGKGWFEIGVDYSAGAPEYWRECLVDLIPLPGELDEEDDFLY